MIQHGDQRVPSTASVVVRISAVIWIVEFAIMMALGSVDGELGFIAEAALDAVLLSGLSAPLIYYWAILPFIRARNAAEQSVRHLALHDPLTGLPNRRLLDEHIRTAVDYRVRERNFGALLLVDLDGFKPINDTYGHETGDLVLQDIARRIQATLRQTDVAARLGGDEFVVLLNHVGDDAATAAESATTVADKLRASIASPIELRGVERHVDASIGVKLIEPAKQGVESLLRDADAAMYEAKKAGRARVVLFAHAAGGSYQNGEE
jgi:diguanylate cyclase (GGDEF)-like protein